MDRIKVIGGLSEPLPFSVTFGDPGTRLYINVFDTLSSNTFLHLEFDKPNGQILVKDRYDGVWSKPVAHAAELKGSFVRGEITCADSTFRIRLKDFELEHPARVPEGPRIWNIYGDFGHFNLGKDEPVHIAHAARWRFFPVHKRREGNISTLRALGSLADLPAGLTGLYLWDGDEAALSARLEAMASSFDELMVVVHDSGLYRPRFFAELQSRHFNLRTCLAETMVKSDGKVRKMKGALFLNRVLSQVRFRTVMFVNSSAEVAGLQDLVASRRLRSRQDDFVLLDEKARGRVQAFSLGETTQFVDADGKAQLEPGDLALRLALHGPSVAPGASLEWDIGDMAPADVRLTVHDRQKKIKAKSRAKLVVFVVSCRKNRHRQQAIRDSWAKDARNANIEVCFVEGHAAQREPVLVDDRLILPCPDTYEYLSHKVWHAFKAVLAFYDADFIMKIDDDCLLNPQKLLEFRYEDFDYMGSDINAGSRTALDWHHSAVSNRQLGELIFELDAEQTWYDGQGGYILSRRAAQTLASTPLADYQHMLEDYATGRVMSLAGFPATRLDSSFISVRDAFIKEDRDYENAVISDIAGVERMFELHEIISSRNQQFMEGRKRWRFEFAKP